MTALATGFLALSLALLVAPGAGAGTGGPGHVDVIEVSGLIDPVLVDFIGRSLDEAEREGAVALVIQLNSRGGVVSRQEIDALLFRLTHSSVPVGVWVGPDNARAYGDAARLVAAAEPAGLAQGTRVGNITDPIGAPDEVHRALRNRTVNRTEARRLGLADVSAPILGDLIVEIPGVETKVVDTDGTPQREPVTEVRFAKLGLLPRLLHTAASPPVAYLLLLVGLALLVFEFFTAGVGVAGGVGAVSLVLSAYGLSVLPTTAVGLALLAVAFFGFAVDVQTGAPRFWTAAATVTLVLGSLLLFDDGVSLSWVPLTAGIVGTLLMMLGGMPSMVRSRFSTPTIGREWMIGEVGEAVHDVRPDGVVRVREALWRARTNRATPIGHGDPVRVVGIDGLLLEVEPEDGGARDYRDGRARS